MSAKPKKEPDLRERLQKLLPGFKWTVHKQFTPEMIEATGTQSRGSNRIATITVKFWPRHNTIPKIDSIPWYEVKIFGYGTKGEHMGTGSDWTLASAVRSVQKQLEHRADINYSLAQTIQTARKRS